MAAEKLANTRGVFGGAHVRHLKHELDHWVINQIRASRGLSPLPLPPLPEDPQLVSLKTTCERVGASRISIWKWEKAGTFPKRVRIGPNGVIDRGKAEATATAD